MEILYKNYFLHFVSLLLSMEGESPGQYSYAPILPGPKEALTKYRNFHILLNGQWVGFSKEICYHTQNVKEFSKAQRHIFNFTILSFLN